MWTTRPVERTAQPTRHPNKRNLTLYEIGRNALSPCHIASCSNDDMRIGLLRAKKAWNCNGLVSFSGPNQIESNDVSYRAYWCITPKPHSP